MTKQYCSECFAEMEVDENTIILCDECLSEQTVKTVKKKIVVIDNTFAPNLEGVTWEWVKSPYKKYKEN